MGKGGIFATCEVRNKEENTRKLIFGAIMSRKKTTWCGKMEKLDLLFVMWRWNIGRNAKPIRRTQDARKSQPSAWRPAHK